MMKKIRNFWLILERKQVKNFMFESFESLMKNNEDNEEFDHLLLIFKRNFNILDIKGRIRIQILKTN